MAVFNTDLGHYRASLWRGKNSPHHWKFLRRVKMSHTYFQRFSFGIPVAICKNRRSGAQRGASENNFGQRFSVSTPCLFAKRFVSPPHPSNVIHLFQECRIDSLYRPHYVALR